MIQNKSHMSHAYAFVIGDGSIIINNNNRLLLLFIIIGGIQEPKNIACNLSLVTSLQRIDNYHFARKSIIKMLHLLATSPSGLDCYCAKCQTLLLLLANWCYGQASQSFFMPNS